MQPFGVNSPCASFCRDKYGVVPEIAPDFQPEIKRVERVGHRAQPDDGVEGDGDWAAWTNGRYMIRPSITLTKNSRTIARKFRRFLAMNSMVRPQVKAICDAVNPAADIKNYIPIEQFGIPTGGSPLPALLLSSGRAATVQRQTQSQEEE